MPSPAATHPETLRIVQTIHDTVHVVVRDTVVRVAEPQVMDHSVSLVAGLATILVTVVATYAYLDARRKARQHLLSHILIARNWIQGPSPVGPPTGWSMNDVTPQVALDWRHPRKQQVPLFSGSALSEVTLLQNVFLPKSLTPLLASVAQNIEAFNDVIAQYNAFKMSDPQLFLSVEHKLDAGMAAIFPPQPGVPNPPPNMTQANLTAILTAAALTPVEAAWADNLFHMLVHAHVKFIGSATGQAGLFQRVRDLEAEFVRTVGHRGGRKPR